MYVPTNNLLETRCWILENGLTPFTFSGEGLGMGAPNAKASSLMIVENTNIGRRKSPTF
jgi:hypothetical protein